MIQFLKQQKVFLLTLTFILTLLGLNALFTIPKESQPSINIPMYSVSFTYPGADPESVEQQITDKLEQKFKTITKVKEITSTSAYSFGMIVLEFDETKDSNEALNDIKMAIDWQLWSLPSIKYPSVVKIWLDAMPIYTFSLAWEKDTKILYNQAQALEDKLKSVPWVSDVKIIWKPNDQIQIYFDYQKLKTFWLEFNQVINNIKSKFFSFPSDKKLIGQNLYSLQLSTYTKQNLFDSVKNLVLYDKDNKRIYLSDVANIFLAPELSDKKSFYVDSQNNIINAISYQITKSPGYDVQKLTDDIISTINEFKKSNSDLKIVESSSQKEVIESTYDLFLENFFETWGLVFLIILLFLWFKSSVVILISFIIVYLIDFLFLKSIGYTFNNIVSFSLILVLWVMVDNLIVITEWIVQGRQAWHNNIRDAISYSLKNYSRPVIFWTLTTVVIFFPLMFALKGTMWAFMKPFPVTVNSNLLISLFWAIIVLPLLSSVFMKNMKEFKPSWLLIRLEHIWEWIWKFFYKISSTKISSFFVLIIFWIIFWFWISLVANWVVKVDFLWNIDSNNMWINIKYKPWIDITQNQILTNNIYKSLDNYIWKNFTWVVDHTTIDLWVQKSSSTLGQTIWNDNFNLVSFTYKLFPKDHRKTHIMSYELVEKVQNYSNSLKSQFPMVEEINVITAWAWPTWNKPVSFYLVWDDLNQIGEYINNILPKIQQIEWLYNVSTSIEYTNWKLTYIVDTQKSESFWIPAQNILAYLQAMKNSYYQPNWITLKDFNEFWKDVLSMKWFLVYSWNIKDIQIWNIYLNQLLKQETLDAELKSISKIDWQKSIQISASKTNNVPISIVNEKIQKIFEQNPIPAWIEYTTGWSTKMMAESWQQLGVAMWIWIMLCFMVLVYQFWNLKYPIIIFTSIFLTIAWAMFMLAITGYPFSFPAQLWIFWVLWVWINQWIIHIDDYIEIRKHEVNDSRRAFMLSIPRRFVPIFLTKLTTILGLVILAMKDELFWAMAIAFIWGLLMSFFITLIYMPVLVSIFDREKTPKSKLRLFRKKEKVVQQDWKDTIIENETLIESK